MEIDGDNVNDDDIAYFNTIDKMMDEDIKAREAGDPSVVLDSKELKVSLETLKKLKLNSNTISLKVRKNDVLICPQENKKIKIKIKPLFFEHKYFNVLLNLNYLLDAIKTGDDKIQISYNKKATRLLANYCLVMPIKK